VKFEVVANSTASDVEADRALSDFSQRRAPQSAVADTPALDWLARRKDR
jgi:hypothetical protein